MDKDSFKRAAPILPVLGAMILLAGAALFITPKSVSGQATEPNRQPMHECRLAYVSGGSYAAGGFSQRAQSGDYLAEIAAEGYHLWPAQRFPLRVYIDDGRGVPGYRQSFSQIVAEAFQSWSQVSQGRISWTPVASPYDADIVARWNANPRPRGGGVEAGVTETVTQVDPRTGSGSIRSAKISLLTQLAGRSFSDTDMRKTALHEVGHSLGLEGHSRSPSDIMFAAVNPAQVPYLKERDANTINRLYGDRQNTGSTVAAAPRQEQYVPQSTGPGNYYDGGAEQPNPYHSPSPYRSYSPYRPQNPYATRNPYAYGNGYGANFDSFNRAALRARAWQMAREMARRAAYR